MQDTNIGIYRWTSPSGKMYIGQAFNLRSRKIDFLCDPFKRIYTSKKGLSPVDRARRKYPPRDWKYDVLEYCNSKEELGEREKYWIAYYKTTDNHYGYNVTAGGTGGCGVPKTAFKKGHIMSEEYKQKARETRKRNIENGVYEKKVREHIIGKPVVAYTLEGVFVGVYISLAECKRELGISIDFKQSRCGNYMIRYATDNIPMFIDPYNPPPRTHILSEKAKQHIKEVNRARQTGLRHPEQWKPVKGTHNETGEVVTFPSITDACKAVNPSNIKAAGKNIDQAIKGKRRSAYGYKWEYAS